MKPLLERLGESDKKFIISHCTKEVINKGDYIFKEGDIANKLFFILKGKIKVHKSVKGNKEINIFTRYDHDSFGEIGVFSGNRYSCSAKAVISSQILSIEKDQIEKIIKEHGHIALQFLKWVSESLEASKAKIRDYLMSGAEGAVASLLIRLSNMVGEETPEGIFINQAISNGELGRHIGISRETVNRITNKWKNKGIIDIDNRYYLIKDISYFHKLLACDRCGVVNCVL